MSVVVTIIVLLLYIVPEVSRDSMVSNFTDTSRGMQLPS